MTSIVTRRDFLGASVVASRAAGRRGSLEGWDRAGVRYVEINDGLLERFLGMVRGM